MVSVIEDTRFYRYCLNHMRADQIDFTFRSLHDKLNRNIDRVVFCIEAYDDTQLAEIINCYQRSLLGIIKLDSQYKSASGYRHRLAKSTRNSCVNLLGKLLNEKFKRELIF